MIQDVECVRADLETHPLIYSNALRQGHVQLREHWAVDRAPCQRSKLTWTVIEKYLTWKRRLAKRRCASTIGVDHRRIDVVDDAVLIEDTDEVIDLIVRETGDCRLVCCSAYTVQGTSRVNDSQRCTSVDS